MQPENESDLFAKSDYFTIARHLKNWSYDQKDFIAASYLRWFVENSTSLYSRNVLLSDYNWLLNKEKLMPPLKDESVDIYNMGWFTYFVSHVVAFGIGSSLAHFLHW